MVEPEHTRDKLAELSDEELVDKFLARVEGPREEAHRCFEALVSRYMGLITHVVRSSGFRYPAWDSPDDVVARVVFKVYRGLNQWRREGKLSSFVARIATSEMIDTIRRVTRDKSWDPRPADLDSDLLPLVERAPSAGPSPEESASASEHQNIINALLSDVCRDEIDTAIVDEYLIASKAAKDISEKHNITEDLVYQRARRLKVRLLKWLNERGIESYNDFLRAAGSGTK